MRRIVVCFLFIATTVGCATIPNRVIRDSQTYTLEILAGLQREKDAASVLFEAADAAKDSGDAATCQIYVHPALVIHTKAQAQAYRALWLAGLPYPLEDGSLPDPKDEQDDPGAAQKVAEDAAENYCLDDAPDVDPPASEPDPAPAPEGDNE